MSVAWKVHFVVKRWDINHRIFGNRDAEWDFLVPELVIGALVV